MEAEAGTVLTAPFWATAWLGGQAVARYVLDHPATVAGRRVLDVASGSGLVAIAAGLAGAAAVTANDIDPYTLAAITLNAKANGVAVSVHPGDLLDGDGGDADVVLAGDVFYSEAIAVRMWPFLHRAAARGARALVGDPGRGHLPGDQLTIVTSHPVPAAGASAEPQISRISVLQPR
jgi:predicted nicotinamide N-methyase